MGGDCGYISQTGNLIHTSRKSFGEREREGEREASFCFRLWIEALLLIAKLRSWLEEEAEEGVKKKAESLLAMIHAVSLLQLRGQLGFRFFGFSLLERDDASVSSMRFLVVREYVCIYGKHLRKIG